MTAPDRDPLRIARRAVSAHRFREAMTELAELRETLGSSAEWLLLAAMAAWRLGDFRESLDYARLALSGYRVRGDVDGEMRSHNVAAAGHFALGELDNARDGFQRALDLARQLHDIMMTARCANNLGNVCYYRAENARALSRYGQAATAFERVGSMHGVAEAYHNMGVVLREEGELDSARVATDRALEAAESLEDQRTMGWALGARGETDALRGDLPLGRAELERSLELARGSDDRLTEIDTLRVLGIVERLSGDLELAAQRGAAAVALAQKAGSKWALARAEFDVADTLARLGLHGDARRSYRAAADEFARMGADSRAQKARARAEEI